jgi:uncharacterized membrane protein
LEAFSDGVFAVPLELRALIAITLLILEIKVPLPGTAIGLGCMGMSFS